MSDARPRTFGEVAITALTEFARANLPAGPAYRHFAAKLLELVEMGAVAFIDEANTAHVAGESLRVEDRRK